MTRSFARGLAAVLCVAAACGPGGSSDDDDDDDDPIDARRVDGGGTIIDGGTVIDGPTAPIDGPAATTGIGAICTGEGQGSCPTGYECLNLEGGSGSWCSKRCTGTADMSCSAGYTGPGYAACLLNVTPAGGGAAVPFCTVLCFDAPGAPTYCPGGDSQCNQTCPTPLACTAEIGSPVQAKLCE